MDVNQIVNLVNEIPKLLDIQKKQSLEIECLKSIINNLSNNEALDKHAVANYTGYSLRYSALIMKRLGAEVNNRKLWISKQTLINYLTKNNLMSPEETEAKAREYLSNKKLKGYMKSQNIISN